jgi:mannose/cellobiose epimerase-like protein (N-acyl-D-glucosamine 2-epimerase family)
LKTQASETAQQASLEFIQWAADAAFPLWWRTGVDHANGGFFEKIDRDGRPVCLPRRARVLGRQIYAFAQAESLGWKGSSDKAVRHGLAYLPRFVTSSGLVNSLVDQGGEPIEGPPDLYDHAFVLFGLAAAALHHPQPRSVADRAVRMRERIMVALKHPDRGFEEARPRRLPLRSNPHMHMLEAAMAWSESDAVLSDTGWKELANNIAELALEAFVDVETGALYEHFDGSWRPAGSKGDRIIEPGHQYEWGWLLIRWGLANGRSDAIDIACRMIEVAEKHGFDSRRNVVINELNDDFSVRDPSARLWPQTERIKAWAIMYWLLAPGPQREQALERTASAIRSLSKYLRRDLRGAYYDCMSEYGELIEEPAPASSLYHIICSAKELQLRLNLSI